MSSKISIETVTNGAVIVTCMAMLAFMVRHGFLPEIAESSAVIVDGAGSPQPPAIAPYRTGESVGEIAGIQFDRSRRTLLMALRSDCPYCTASMPFYQRLVTRCRENGDRTSVRFVAITSESEPTMHNYLEGFAVPIDEVVSLEPAATQDLRLHATPTLLLTDQKGVVESVWVGQLPAATEDAVISQICNVPA